MEVACTILRELFVAGSAGERFAVRNSGAVAVVEGDHATLRRPGREDEDVPLDALLERLTA